MYMELMQSTTTAKDFCHIAESLVSMGVFYIQAKNARTEIYLHF